MTRKEIIEHMKVMADHAKRNDVVLHVMTVKDLNVVKEAAELLTARPARHVHEEYPEHDWRREESGAIDLWAMDTDYHHGPVCVRCLESFCVHCEPKGYETHKRCVVDWYECPECGRHISKGQSYCQNCGKGIVWNG